MISTLSFYIFILGNLLCDWSGVHFRFIRIHRLRITFFLKTQKIASYQYISEGFAYCSLDSIQIL